MTKKRKRSEISTVVAASTHASNNVSSSSSSSSSLSNVSLLKLVVGSRIKVFWEKDNEWFYGHCDKKLKGQWNIKYDDGDERVEPEIDLVACPKEEGTLKRKRIIQMNEEETKFDAKFKKKKER